MISHLVRINRISSNCQTCLVKCRIATCQISVKFLVLLLVKFWPVGLSNFSNCQISVKFWPCLIVKFWSNCQIGLVKCVTCQISDLSKFQILVKFRLSNCLVNYCQEKVPIFTKFLSYLKILH